MTKSIIQEWVTEKCTLKQQGVLLSAIRGCDGIPKADPTRQLTRGFRAVILNPAQPKTPTRTFMDPVDFDKCLEQFLSGIDPYPVHWVMHFAYACQVIGYKHPDSDIQTTWYGIYKGICKELHVNVETENQMDERLG